MESKSKLLIVHDNAATRNAIRRLLERHGYAALEAGTGTEGLGLIASEEIDAVILDVNLPDMSGFDIVRQLRTDDRTRLLPVIHVSAASIQTRDIITGLDAGADAYLIHPVDPDVLLATLRTLLRFRDAERGYVKAKHAFVKSSPKSQRRLRSSIPSCVSMNATVRFPCFWATRRSHPIWPSALPRGRTPNCRRCARASQVAPAGKTR